MTESANNLVAQSTVQLTFEQILELSNKDSLLDSNNIELVD